MLLFPLSSFPRIQPAYQLDFVTPGISPGERELAEADAAQRELADDSRAAVRTACSGCDAGTPSFGVLFALAVASFSSLAIFAVVAIRPFLVLNNYCLTTATGTGERHAHLPQQSQSLGIRFAPSS